MPAELLRVQDAEFRYEESDWRLGAVSMTLSAGEMLAIIGPNGSGKSTLLRIAAGILQPASGKVLLEGRDIKDIPRREIARCMGYLPQGIASVFDYAVEQVVGMGRFPHMRGLGFLSSRDLRVIENCMEQTETLPFRDRPLSRLSGGERQRAYLAGVLAQEPRVLLLDEPTTALDIHHQGRFFGLLQRLADSGMGIAVVTHDLNLASFYATRLMLLSEGRLRAEGSAEQVVRPDVLAQTYGDNVRVERDAASGKPFVLPPLQPAAGARP